MASEIEITMNCSNMTHYELENKYNTILFHVHSISQLMMKVVIIRQSSFNSPKAAWLGDILSHCEHFCGSELCLLMCSFRIYRLLSHASQISHWTRSLRTEYFICTFLIWANTSARVVNVLAQYSQISVFAASSVSWNRIVCDFRDSSVLNLNETEWGILIIFND